MPGIHIAKKSLEVNFIHFEESPNINFVHSLVSSFVTNKLRVVLLETTGIYYAHDFGHCTAITNRIFMYKSVDAGIHFRGRNDENEITSLKL